MPDRQPTSIPHKTRVDSAHGMESHCDIPSVDPANHEVLAAIAGTDTKASTRQLRGQAMELSSYLQEKQSLLDRRESEMNARLAVLENESRIARLRNEIRLKGTPAARKTTAAEANSEPVVKVESLAAAKSSFDCGIALDESTDESIDFTPLTSVDVYEPQRHVSEAERKLREDFAKSRRNESQRLEEPTPPQAAATTSTFDPPTDNAAEQREAVDQFEAMRRSLEEQRADLGKREQHLQALHDEITELHRESLELRVATEHVWTDFRGHMPDEELANSLAQHRAKLADHYKIANDELCRRREVLHQLQNYLSQQDERLRSERMDMQMWIDRQRNEVEAKSATISAREFEFERREAELQRQSITWQKQREEYRHEIEQLSRRLRYTNA